MSNSYELGRISYYGEHRSAEAISRLVDEKLISNLMAALNNKYISAAITQENKKVIASVISSHVSIKSKIAMLKQTYLKGGSTTEVSPSVLLSQTFYHYENDDGKAMSLLADEELISNMIATLSNDDITVSLSKSDFDRIVNTVATHVSLKALLVRQRQDEIVASNERAGYSI